MRATTTTANGMERATEEETRRSQTDERPTQGADGGDFVAQCRVQARALTERKQDQEERLSALVESSFGQLERIFNALLQAAQDSHATAHAQFEDAAAVLEENLNRHEQVEAKLRAIMAILLGGSSQ